MSIRHQPDALVGEIFIFILTLYSITSNMVRLTLKIWQQFCWKIFKVYLATLGIYVLKGKVLVANITTLFGLSYYERSLTTPCKDWRITRKKDENNHHWRDQIRKYKKRNIRFMYLPFWYIIRLLKFQFY